MTISHDKIFTCCILHSSKRFTKTKQFAMEYAATFYSMSLRFLLRLILFYLPGLQSFFHSISRILHTTASTLVIIF